MRTETNSVSLGWYAKKYKLRQQSPFRGTRLKNREHSQHHVIMGFWNIRQGQATYFLKDRYNQTELTLFHKVHWGNLSPSQSLYRPHNQWRNRLKLWKEKIKDNRHRKPSRSFQKSLCCKTSINFSSLIKNSPLKGIQGCISWLTFIKNEFGIITWSPLKFQGLLSCPALFILIVQ